MKLLLKALHPSPKKSASSRSIFVPALLSSAVAAFIVGCALDASSDNRTSTAKTQSMHQAAIASAHPHATEAGMEVLRNGGNAFDAAVAVAATLGVVEPYSAGIGGGGFWLLYDADGLDKQGNPLESQYVFVDAREKAPISAHRDMYLGADTDGDGEPDVDRSKATTGPLAAGIPGQAAAFAHLAKKYGKLPLKQSLEKAIYYADNGFNAGHIYVNYLENNKNRVIQFPSSKSIFFKNGEVPKEGDLIVQKDLAKTLRAVADKGFDGFYKGTVATKMVESVQANQGIWTLDDLANYQVIEREPIQFEVDGYRFISAPPPSSGGVALATILKTIEKKDYNRLNKVDQTHLLIEAMRHAYRDRAEFLGDTDFVNVPVKTLISNQHAEQLAAKISMAKATPSEQLGQKYAVNQGNHTTHFSIIDQEGNRVSATLSINLSYGSGFVAEGTGVLLNNEMDDFSSKPGSPNAFGLVGSEANAIEAGKRPLSSMTPTMIESDKGVAVIGTPGGSRIITMVLLGALEHMEGKPVEAWVNRPRFHHQYLPDAVTFETKGEFQGLTLAEQSALKIRGHKLAPKAGTYGNMQAVFWDATKQELSAASDKRGEGSAKVEVIQ